ncbi:zinc-dependent alcohol dehydrogenase family protein [Fulvivirga sp. 29W222]|uniref:alcohol dehydrogenase n=2 Tax=Fulvivirga marina TaxID=2494733 RepID=A0A937KFX4_9BACT|nr:zinc-dependent alcohol dehydrogenase family protein [Fulvivirga marina]
MKAWLLNEVSDLSKITQPLAAGELPIPSPKEGEVLIKVLCCGICHTELDEIEGRIKPNSYPIIPGHQVVGVVMESGLNVTRHKKGDRVGVAWIFSACGQCEYCLTEQENLCSRFKATGRDFNGGYAEYMTVNQFFAYKIPESISDTEAAPLLCAGAIGYRSLCLAQLSDGQTLGLTGFGASGHLVLKMTKYLYPNSEIFVFARSKEQQQFALSLGARWAGDIKDIPLHKANAIIDTTPVWNTIIGSLLYLKPGGRLVINAIRKEPYDQKALLDISYEDHLWMEKEIKSVANITRADIEEFLKLAAKIPIKPKVEIYAFGKANEALLDLKHKHVNGAKVLMVAG